MMLTIQTNAREVSDRLSGMARQMPFAASLAINKTAQLVKKAIVEEMKRVFDRPTAFTLNSLFLTPSSKYNLEAMVWLKDDYSIGTTGTPASKYLSPQIYGGPRNAKSHELRLREAGILGSKLFVVPAQGASELLDRYGNFSGGLIRQITSGLGVDRRIAGYESNITPASRRRNRKRGQYFVIGGYRPQGIARRVTGGELQPVLWFVRAPNYRPRLDFFGVGQKVIDENLENEMVKAIDLAIRTAR